MKKILLLLLLPILLLGWCVKSTPIDICVTGKERITNSAWGKYLVYTDSWTYEITDSLFNFRFDSSDLYGSIENECYTAEIDLLSWRVPFLSWYENIITISFKS